LLAAVREGESHEEERPGEKNGETPQGRVRHLTLIAVPV